MKKLVEKLAYTWVWVSSLWISSAQAALSTWDVQSSLKWTEQGADQAVQSIVTNIISFLYLVAVLYGLWGWFNILTAGWDEEKVKKWKNVLIQALIWLVVIWLASSIVSWLLTSILK